MKEKAMIDVLIVGQGLAGTLLAYFLKKSGKKIMIVDDGHKSSSSKVAAGFINPVTGRKYTKSWLIDDLIPFARKTYDALGSDMNTSLYVSRNIIRTIPDVRSDNNWHSRLGDSEYSTYLEINPNLGILKEMINTPFSFGEITQSMQVDLTALLERFRTKYFQDIITEKFDFQHLKIVDKDNVVYKNIRARKIVFCEGYKGKDNPLFSYLPFEGAKGEVLIVKIKGYNSDKILRHKIFVAPLGDETYWVGSGYAWDLDNIAPTEKEKARMLALLKKILKVPFEVIDHKAGVRPSTKDRRPFLGVHPVHHNVYIFNGLGTKGSSLGPYWADHMVKYIIETIELNPVVDIIRYSNLYG